MSDRKKRILFCNEASYLNTGYSTYGREVMQRLHDTGKYELAELASYGEKDAPQGLAQPWKFFGNLPENGNQVQQDQYHGSPTNQFGEWLFEEVCIVFQPDIVCDIRDHWMLDFQERSPFRKYFNWVIMPTCDAEPQATQWLATYATADSVFSYSKWGANELKSEGCGKVEVIGRASPSANPQFTPVPDKEAHKQKMGFAPESRIVGTIMRNQRRKLYPDLFESFKKFLVKTGEENVFLYCHTSYPDVGWDVPSLIKEHGLSSKTILTYVCPTDLGGCGFMFPSFFRDAITECPRCHRLSARTANVKYGVPSEFLASIINTFDLYVQYANSEGFGLPQVEAAACGVPIMSVDYSAMSSVVRNLGGTPLKVARLNKELETGCNRAVPDNDFLAMELEKFFRLPRSMRATLGFKARKLFEEKYQWDQAAKQWENYFDSVPIKNIEETWKSPLSMFDPTMSIPQSQGSYKELVQWMLVNVLGENHRLNSYMESRMIRDLNYQTTTGGTGGMYFNESSHVFQKPALQQFDIKQCHEHLVKLCHRRNFWEEKRVQLVK